MKVLCWSCSEPRDTMEESCPQCGAEGKPAPKKVTIEVKEKTFKPVKTEEGGEGSGRR